MTDSATASVSGSTSNRPEVPPPHARRHPRLNRARVAAVTAANRLAADVMPRVPDYAKRFMARAITIDGNTLDPTMQMMLASLKLSGEEGLSAADDPAACRQNMLQLTQLLDRHRLPVGGVTDLSIPGPAGDIPARHYRPDNDELGPLLVFFHGGGYVLGDLDTADNGCRMICRGAGIHVLSIDYRLAPEHPAPAAVDDCYAAYRWALEQGSQLGTKPGVVAVGGDSAGGALSAVVSLLGRDDGVPPALQMLLYPWADQRGGTRSRALFGRGFLLTQRDLDWFRGHYLGRSDVEIGDPRVSPLLAPELSGLPRALVITAGFDPLRDEGEAYAVALRKAGVMVDLRRMSTLVHGFANLWPLGGDSTFAMAEIVSALRAHLCYAV